MKKKFQAIKADVGDYSGIRHDGKEFRFRRDDTFIIEDEGLAREMDQVHGIKGTQKVAITPYDDTQTREPGHNYRFTGVDTSHFKVWVLKRGKVARVTKAQAQRQGYKIISGSRQRPRLAEAQ